MPKLFPSSVVSKENKLHGLKPSSILLELREMMKVLEKNRKKLENKKRRGMWTCARPVTQVVPNRKKRTRQQNKQELKRRIREDSSSSFCINR